MQHYFDVSIAEQYGVNVAIFLNHMSFWIVKNVANNTNYHDGAYWTYNTVESYTTIFPYLSARQIRKVILDCEKFGLINISNYNDTKYDRTQWYSLTEKSAKLLNISILPKGKMDFTKRANGFYQKGKPIPGNNPDNKTKRERARKKRVPLPPDFLPSDRMMVLLDETAKRTNNQREVLLKKFKNVMIETGKTSLDWQVTFENFMLSERVNTENDKSDKSPPWVKNETKSCVIEYGPGHPTWEANQEWKRKHAEQGSDAPRDSTGSTDLRTH